MDFDGRRILDALSDAVIAAGRDGRIVYANHRAEALLGWDPGTLLGQPLLALVPNRLHAAHSAGFQRYLTTGEARLIGHPVRVPALCRDGSELEFELSLGVIHEAEGPLFVASMRKVPERQKAAERALAESEARLQAIFNQVGVGVAQTDLAGRFLLVNEHYCELVGRTRSELLKLRMQDITHPDDLRENVDQFSQLIDHGREFVIEKRYLRPDRKEVWVRNSVSLVRGPDGVPQSTVAISENITAHKEIQEALRTSEQRFRTVFEGAGLGIALVGLDGCVLDSNPALQKMLGYTAEELVGMNAREVTHPDDVYADEGLFLELLAGERAHYQLEKRYVRKDGAVVWGQLTVSLVYGADGLPLFGAGMVQDVTEQRRAREALREGEERLRAIADNSPSVIFLKDLEGRYLLMNRHEHTRLWDQPREAVIGKTDFDLFPPQVAEYLRENDHRVLAAGRTLVFEEFEDGHLPRYFLSYKFPLFREDGSAYALGGISTEISELKHLQNELRERVKELAEADRKKDEFLATLAHELRNPLAGITNSLYLLRGFDTPEPRAVELREIISRQNDYLARLVDDLLDVSRITRGLIELQLQELDLAEVVARAVDSNRSALDARAHTLEVVPPAAPLCVSGDPVRLEQVLTNLLSNAAKYTPAGGTIRLSTARDGDRAVLQVADNGVGIPADLLPRIFDLFTQADRSHARTHGGLGIGLHLVRRLVELHDGTIEAHSPGPGLGSTFTVTLPILLSSSPSNSSSNSSSNSPSNSPPHPFTSSPPHFLAPPTPESGGSEGTIRDTQPSRAVDPSQAGSNVPRTSPGVQRADRVLIIEDNLDAAETLREILELHGREVAVANSGPEGVARAREWQPEVVLCDIGLPGMDGYQVAAELRSHPELAGLQLIAVTGFGQQEDERRAREAGFDRHLTKPIQPDLLLALLTDPPPPVA